MDAAPIQAVLVDEPQDRLRRGMWWHHAILLAAATLTLLAAALLTVRGERQVALPFVGWTLPESCTWRLTLGWDCPGCGLTRCFVSMAHGDPSRAWHFHPVGVFLFAAVAFQVPYRVWQLARLAARRPPWPWPKARHLPWILIAPILIQWVVRMIW